jgi:hypothetical protein
MQKLLYKHETDCLDRLSPVLSTNPSNKKASPAQSQAHTKMVLNQLKDLALYSLKVLDCLMRAEDDPVDVILVCVRVN